MSRDEAILHTPRGSPLSRRSNVERGLILTVLAFTALATAFNVIVPPYENLDELEHAEVARHIAVTGRLPIHDEAEAAGYHVRQEASQPPLYHILAAGVIRLFGLSTAPHQPRPVPGSLVACGLTGTLYNKTTWIHDPYNVASGGSSARATIHALRAFSTALQVTTLVGIWTLARRIFPQGPLPYLAAGIVAFNPQFLLLAAGVNNDNAVIPLATWGLLLAFEIWDQGPTWARSLSFGLISGLAALSKLSGAALVGLGGLALLARLIKGRSTAATVVAQGTAMAIVALALVTPWALRNLTLYNDPTALAPMLAKVGRRSGPIALGEIRLMTLSFWGQLPCTFYPRALYWPFLGLMLGGLGGIVIRWRRLSPRRRGLLTLSGIWFIVITLAWVRWDMMTAATGGRLLFPAIAAFALILATGWTAWGRRVTRVWAAGLPVWALVVLGLGSVAAVAPPKLVAATPDSPTATKATFGHQVDLVDYTTRITTTPVRCLLLSGAYCSQVLDLELSYRAPHTIEENLTMVVQLVSAAPGATELRLNYNYWPGRGNLPTSRWPAGALIRDRYLLPLPASDVETQAWRLTLAFVEPTSGNRLPVAVEGATVGDHLTLAQVRVAGRRPVAGSVEELSPPVVFGTGRVEEALRLVGADVGQDDQDQWTVALLWESGEAVEADAIVFVHAYDEAGQLLATGDGPPKGGAFPTSLWEPGDRILTRHRLNIDAASPPHTIAVGLYLPDSGLRLAALADGEELPDNAVVIWRHTQ